MKTLNKGLIICIIIIGLSVCTAVLADESATANQSQQGSFNFFELIEVLGVCALSSLLIAFLTGIFRRKLGRKFFLVHKLFAWLGIIFAVSHGITVMIVF